MIKNYSFLINKTNYLFSPSLNMAFFKTLSTSSKKIKTNNIVAYNLEAINWFNLNKSGFIIPLIRKNILDKKNLYRFKY